MSFLDDIDLGARPNSNDRGRKRWRPQDATQFLARALVVRAIRLAGAHQMLRGGAGVIGAVLEHPEDGQALTTAAFSLLKDRARTRHTIDWRSFDWVPRKRRSSTSWDEHLAEGDREVARIFAVAGSAEDLPGTFLACADGVVAMGRPDTDMLRACFRALGARDPGPLPDAETLSAVPLGAYVAILRRGSVSGAAAKISRLAEACAAATKVRPAEAGEPGPSLVDLHGLGEASAWGKQLAVDLVDYRAGTIGWRDVDKGILLSGPPGTGKTTFARALGRTCQVEVFVHSLARWQANGYLNDLLKSMRGAFAEAQAAAPSILFVDEIDAFGDRAKLEGKNRQYSVEVIAGFLECLDGTDRRTGVVVVGATNDPENVDPAIKRAGRLDRHVVIGLPDVEARAGILRHHLGSELPGVDLAAISAPLDGLSGADLERAARNARRIARTARRPMAVEDLLKGLPEALVLSPETFRRSCVHEAGHLLVGTLLARETASTPIFARVTRTTHGSEGGRTHFERDQGVARTRAHYLAEITVYLSGLAAERMQFGANAHGGGGARGSDLHRATCLAVAVEISLGLGETLAFLEESDSSSLTLHLQRDPRLRETVEGTLAAGMDRAVALLGHHRTALDSLASLLATRGEASFGDARTAMSTPAEH